MLINQDFIDWEWIILDDSPNDDHFNYLRLTLNSFLEKIQEPVTKIKINESIKLIKPVQKNEAPKEEHLINLLQYYELLSEIKKII